MKRTIGLAVAMIGLALTSQAQEVYDLKKCTDLALQQNLQIKSAQYNSDKYKSRKGEATADYLPQIDVEGNYSYYFNIPVQVIPAEAFGGAPGDYLTAKFGLKQSISASIEGTQLIYNQQLINGLKMVDMGKNITQLQVVQKQEDVAYNVAVAYYNLESVYVQKRFAEENLQTISKLKNTTQNLFEAGLAGKSDLDRLSVTLNNIESAHDQLVVAETQLYRYLKFLMNLDLSTPIVIDTTGLTDKPELEVLTEAGQIERTEVQLLKNQMNLLNLQSKNALAAYIPTLAAYGGFSYTGYNPDFAFFKTINNNSYYPASYVGLSLSIPLFDGLKSKYQHDQLKLDLQVTRTDLELLENSVDMEVAKAVDEYNLQYKQALSLKENLDLATSVYTDLQDQYRNGLIGIADLLTAENSLREAQSNYSGAVVKLRSALLEYKKASGNILN